MYKATEKVAAIRLECYLEDNDLLEHFQSVYKAGHDTEPALTCVHNDILRAINDGHFDKLVLIVYSAACDAVDHSRVSYLQTDYSIKGKVLVWLRSYLLHLHTMSSLQGEILHGVFHKVRFSDQYAVRHVYCSTRWINQAAHHNVIWSIIFMQMSHRSLWLCRPSANDEPEVSYRVMISNGG